MVVNTDALRSTVVGSTSAVGGARTINTGVRLYAPNSLSTGAGVPNAERVVTNQKTTIMSDAALLALTAAGGIGAIGLYQRTGNR